MKDRPHILITNDDGVYAKGIQCLWEALKDTADLTVVAPDSEQSGKALSITAHDPLQIKEVHWMNHASSVWGVNGTPADCIKLGLSVLLKDNPPDLVVSGINCGSNAGRNVLYSGTVAGAIEGIMHQIPSIAFSCYNFINTNYQVAMRHIPKIVAYTIEHALPSGTLLNVNFPHEEVKGFKMTRQGKEFWLEDPHKRDHPFGDRHYYWLGAKKVTFKEEEDCDITWLERGYATAVPVHIGELTDHRHLADGKHHFEDFLS